MFSADAGDRWDVHAGRGNVVRVAVGCDAERCPVPGAGCGVPLSGVRDDGGAEPELRPVWAVPEYAPVSGLGAKWLVSVSILRGGRNEGSGCARQVHYAGTHAWNRPL